MTKRATTVAALIELPFTILLSQAAVDRLTLLKNAHNAETGQTLTLPDWMKLRLREMAIGAEWAVAVQAIQAQIEVDAAAAVRNARTALLATV